MASFDYQDHPLFPAAAPRGQAHILKVPPEEVDLSSLCISMKYQLCDFIATFLSKLEKYLSALTDFFDPEIKSFKFVREGEVGFLPFMIWRRGKQVFCGFYETFDDGHNIPWENLTRSQLSHVAPNATWTTAWGAWSAYTRGPRDTFWESGFQDVNQPLFLKNDPYDHDDIKQNAFEFGKAIWFNETWSVRNGVHFIVNANREDAEPVPELRLIL